jgi:hypothetical protein
MWFTRPSRARAHHWGETLGISDVERDVLGVDCMTRR